jgi:hypothetical protein
MIHGTIRILAVSKLRERYLGEIRRRAGCDSFGLSAAEQGA